MSGLRTEPQACDSRCVPKGPRGERRPTDVIGNAVHVMQIATGEIVEDSPETGKEYARKGSGRRLETGCKVTKQRHSEIACKAAESRGAKALTISSRSLIDIAHDIMTL